MLPRDRNLRKRDRALTEKMRVLRIELRERHKEPLRHGLSGVIAFGIHALRLLRQRAAKSANLCECFFRRDAQVVLHCVPKALQRHFQQRQHALTLLGLGNQVIHEIFSEHAPGLFGRFDNHLPQFSARHLRDELMALVVISRLF